MKLLAWNCRGLARASTIRGLWAKVLKHSPDVLYLSETKIQPSAACIILNGLGFFLMIHAPPCSSKEVLW
jgi:exonuclease III